LLREYELFYIVRPDLDEEQVRVAMDDVATMVAGRGGEVTKSSLWGRRRLAYTIAGFTDGYYVLKEVGLPAEALRELERQLILDERVIRQLITLKQVYYLPEGEDRRGRVRTRSKDRAAARAEGAVPEAAPEADVLDEDRDALGATELATEPDDVADLASADEGSGEE